MTQCAKLLVKFSYVALQKKTILLVQKLVYDYLLNKASCQEKMTTFAVHTKETGSSVLDLIMYIDY